MHTMFEPPLVVVILVEGSFSLSKRLSAQVTSQIEFLFLFFINFIYLFLKFYL
jgi:hypothetical protein